MSKKIRLYQLKVSNPNLKEFRIKKRSKCFEHTDNLSDYINSDVWFKSIQCVDDFDKYKKIGEFKTFTEFKNFVKKQYPEYSI